MFISHCEKEVPEKELYYVQCLPDKYKKHSNISGPIISLRNVLIILTFVEIASSLWGFSYYFIKRLTTALPGTFFIYQLFELFAVHNTSGGLNDNILLLVFSLPYLYDFAVGVVTIILMSRIAHFNGILQRMQQEDEEAARKLLDAEIDRMNNQYTYSYLQEEFSRREMRSQGLDTCTICMDEKRQVMNMPCRHILICENCRDALTAKSGLRYVRCPSCRAPIEKFEKFFT